MKLRDHIVLHYTVVTLLVTVCVSVGLGWVLTRNATDYLIRSHIDLYPATIHALIHHYPKIHDFLASPPGSDPPEEVKRFFRDVLSLGGVYRIKVWGADGTILWSDKTELVGLSFPEDEHFLEAAAGRVSYELEELQPNAENATEQRAGNVLEIYTPIFRRGKCIGVFELYESDRALFLQIAHSTRYIWGWVFAAGAILYAALFLIFYRSYQRQNQVSRELAQTQSATIFALAFQAELRDFGTGQHLERTARYVRILAEELSSDPEFSDYVTKEYIDILARSAPLHDIGKVGIPDAVLCKPGRLNEAECQEMRQHPELGAAILERAEEKLPFRSFLRMARNIALYHHERWDGEGYPFGLKEEEIPLSARIMALADVYDALRTRRPYKDTFPHDVCVAIIWEESGHQFDPRIVDAFLRRAEDFRLVSQSPVFAEPQGEDVGICDPAAVKA